MAKEPKTSTRENPLLRALSRWENEGGRTDADREKRAALAKEEEALILQCLGAAVISRWNNLPTEVQRGTFRERRFCRRAAPHSGPERAYRPLSSQPQRFVTAVIGPTAFRE